MIKQFQLFEKLTSANLFQIEREKPYDYLLIIQTWKSAGTCFLKPFFRIRENFFQSFLTKFLSLLYMRSLDYKIFHWGPVRGGLYVPVWISNVPTSQFRKVHMSLSEFRPKPLISISINSFAVTVLVHINSRVTCKMSIRRVWRYNSNGARRLWLLFMVT